MNVKWLLRGLIGLTTILLVVVIVMRVQLGRAPDLPVLGEVPPFALTEADGRTITRQDLDGQVWVAAFIFTRCASICPLMSAQMSQLPSRELPLVSFTVDPDHDTTAVLTAYAARYRQAGDRWYFLTGERQAIRDLAQQGFRLTAEDATAEDSEPILHSSHLVLVDRQGRIRGYYDGTNRSAVDQLLQAARRL